MDVLAITLAAAYASRGIPAILTPASGSGPIACVAIAGDVDEVAALLATGARAAGIRLRIRQDEVPFRPKQGDVIALPGEDDLTLRIAVVVTSAFDTEWYLTTTPIVAPISAPSSAIGHLQPPLLGGWPWA